MPADPLPLTFSVESREAAILPAADRAIAALREAGVVGRGEPRLKLALIELLTNAVEHGNRFDPARRVTVTARVEAGGRVAIAIADEGDGMAGRELDRDLESVPLGEKRGRGLALVRKIVGARPRLSGRGNEVTIEFDVSLFA